MRRRLGFRTMESRAFLPLESHPLSLDPPPMNTYPAATRAPEFPPAAPWLNVDRPLNLKLLAGRFVLLEFWTFC